MRHEPENTFRPGAQVPHFTVTTVGGAVFDYATLWQRKNLVLVILPHSAGEDRYVGELAARDADFQALATECVVTHDRIAGLPAPAALVADKWGEIVHVATSPQLAGLPAAAELIEWVDYVERRCPECEGEAR